MGFLMSALQWIEDIIEISIPILIGIAINSIIYAIGIVIFKKTIIINSILFLITGLTLYISFKVGAWVGMGIGVISLGMLITAIFFSVRSLIRPRTLNKEPN